MHYDYLEELADEADLPGSSDRLHVGLRGLDDLKRLEQAGDWQHPGEILDPMGTIGVKYGQAAASEVPAGAVSD